MAVTVPLEDDYILQVGDTEGVNGGELLSKLKALILAVGAEENPPGFAQDLTPLVVQLLGGPIPHPVSAQEVVAKHIQVAAPSRYFDTL